MTVGMWEDSGHGSPIRYDRPRDAEAFTVESERVDTREQHGAFHRRGGGDARYPDIMGNCGLSRKPLGSTGPPFESALNRVVIDNSLSELG